MSAPPVPDIAEGNEVFSTKMRAFHLWEAGSLSDALNAYETARLLSTTTTSVTSNTIGTGDKTFTVASGLGFVAGQSVNAVNTATPSNYMSGFVKSYATTSLVVTAITTGGSGTFTAWSIALGLSGGGASLGTNTYNGVQNFAQGADIASAATINLTTATGNTLTVTGTVATSAVTLAAGMTRLVRAAGAWPLTYNATTNNITGGVSVTLEAGDMVFYQNISGIVYGLIIKASGRAAFENKDVPVRQTVLASPVDTAGLPSFLPATSASLVLTTQNVTSTAPLVATSSNGSNNFGDINRIGQTITNSLSWTVGASTTSYLPATTNADGTLAAVTPVTLAPIVQNGGTPSITNGQYTYNVAEAKMYKGNGTTAPQVFDVIVGVAISGATTITSASAYAIRGNKLAQSMVRLNTANGYGSTNTKIRRFTTAVTNQGADITYADSATLGGSFTINTPGVYAISYSDCLTNSYVGLSLNSSQLTTNINTITTADILSAAFTAIAAGVANPSWVGYLKAGDIIRAHTDGQGTSAGYIAQFTITKVN